MATGKDGFAKVSGVAVTRPLPEFPKLPDCLKRNKSGEDLKQIEEYEAKVQEFFKQQAQRSF